MASVIVACMIPDCRVYVWKSEIQLIKRVLPGFVTSRKNDENCPPRSCDLSYDFSLGVL